MNKPLPLTDHVEIANELSIVQHGMTKVFRLLCHQADKYGTDKTNMNSFIDQWDRVNHELTELKHQLDCDFHLQINDDEYDALGNIYYHLDNRYKNLNK